MATIRTALPVLLLVLGLPGCAPEPPAPAGEAYLAEIDLFRAERQARLRAENGWLSLAGLFWLEEGSNPFGSAPSNPVCLPEDAAPPHAGDLVYDGSAVRLVPAPGVEVRIGGQLAAERLLRDDSEGDPDVLELGRLRFYVIRRADRRAVRVKDPQSPQRTGFRGLDWFPVDPAFRIEGTMRRFDAPREVSIPTVLGTTVPMLAPGSVDFEVEGARYSLLPVVDEPGDTDLFIIFRDDTSGRETYGAGRFLDAALEGDRVIVDFNRAYNPPCAFTPFATCPLPPAENRLRGLAVRAGEKIYPGHPRVPGRSDHDPDL